MAEYMIHLKLIFPVNFSKTLIGISLLTELINIIDESDLFKRKLLTNDIKIRNYLFS